MNEHDLLHMAACQCSWASSAVCKVRSWIKAIFYPSILIILSAGKVPTSRLFAHNHQSPTTTIIIIIIILLTTTHHPMQ